MLVFLLLSLFHTPREARESAIWDKLGILLCVSFLDFLLSIASSPDLNFFLTRPFWMCNFFDFNFVFSTSSCYFHLSIFLGFCGDLYNVPHVSDTYVRGPLFLCFV